MIIVLIKPKSFLVQLTFERNDARDWAKDLFLHQKRTVEHIRDDDWREKISLLKQTIRAHPLATEGIRNPR